ncbi:helix-turn-helix domain-containing protein [Algoriphagus sp.]|uniref:AlbA family DNA-binding domain-containing protein n=1 Tax=Algoriphagus sp. TaxID=1872435 RepID=UPI00391BF537
MKPAKFDKEFIKGLLKENEGLKLDFKQKITSKEKIAKTLSALANTEGGFIVIGMSDKKKIIGIDPEEERYMVEAANEEHCYPQVTLIIDELKIYGENELIEEHKEEISLLLVEVKKSSGPLIFWKNKSGELKAFKRFNDRTIAISI